MSQVSRLTTANLRSPDRSPGRPVRRPANERRRSGDRRYRGELRVVLQNVILLDPDSESETTTFTLRLQDRAGNWSNEVETE